MTLCFRPLAFLILAACALGFVAAPLAQERSAASAQSQQMSWKALSDIATAAEGKVTQINTRVTEGVECGKRGLVYAGKGVTGADATGCMTPVYDSTIINKFIACGNNNQVYSQATDTCKSTSSSSVSANCSLQTTTTRNGTCPAGYSSFGTVFGGYTSSGWHDGCETCNPYYITTCGRTVCQ